MCVLTQKNSGCLQGLTSRPYRTSRAQIQPTNLRERIAALEQRNNASQNSLAPNSRATSPPPTSTGSAFLTPQTTGGALKDRIAKFEKKGGVPVPRGSFGLGAPPPQENGPAKRRGELYGNRIPSSVKSHVTGPQLSGIGTQITGPSPPSWNEARHSFMMMPSDGKIPGLEYNEDAGDTGGFAPPDSALGQPQELAYVEERPPSVPALSDPPVPARVGMERRVASDSSATRRGIAFAEALEKARQAEAVYDPRQITPQHTGSLSPQHTSTSNRRRSTFGVEEVQSHATPAIVVSPDEQVAEPEGIEEAQDEEALHEPPPSPGFDSILDSYHSEDTSAEADEPPTAPKEEAVTPTESQEPEHAPPTPPVKSCDEPLAQEEAKVAKEPIAAAASTPSSPPPSSEPASTAPLSGDESDSGASTSTIQDTRILKDHDDDDDADLFVKPLKRKSDKDLLIPSTPSKNPTLSPSPSPSPSLSPSPSPTPVSPEPSPDAARDSFLSQTVTVASRPESMAETSSPGHVSFAQKFSPVTSRGVPVYIPASKTPSPSLEAQQAPTQAHAKRKESVSGSESQVESNMSEFGVVESRKPPATAQGHLRGYTEPDPQKALNRASTFSAVVHGKVRETHSRTLPASLKHSSSSTPKKQGSNVLPQEPMSPGLNELAMLMAQSALLESQLLNGEYPDEGQARREAEKRERERQVEEQSRREREKEKQDREKEKDRKEQEGSGLKLKRTTSSKSRKSQDSDGRNRKLSLKRVFGSSKKEKETSVPPVTLEAIPGTPPPNPNGGFAHAFARSKSMEMLSLSLPSSSMDMPTTTTTTMLEPPPLPKPTKAHSIHASGIPCVVHAEDALCIVHRVPTGLFIQQLLLHKERLHDAKQLLCQALPYYHAEVDEVDRWNETKLTDPKQPHAFELNSDTLLLVHRNPDEASKMHMPLRIFLHASYVFHYPSRTCLNPKPPSEEVAAVRFPTLEAFYDSLIDTVYHPPRSFYHLKLVSFLRVYLSYLDLYSISDKGEVFKEPDPQQSPPQAQEQFIPRVLDVIERVRFENRPYLIRRLLFRGMPYLDAANERHELRKLKNPDYQIPDPAYPDMRVLLPYGQPEKPDFLGALDTVFGTRHTGREACHRMALYGSTEPRVPTSSRILNLLP
ncbi:hypothetical protein V5O48_005953 [Marasmius crinis-equi]|uniref:Uncharacterized protein n=1 Tax=Marasmius crinis-equi TaxID=585013 RepID=A0ABR3FKV4_9AGAR